MRVAMLAFAIALPVHGAVHEVHEVPRPTSTSVTSAVVECADDRGCVVEHACAGTPLAAPFEDADFDRVATLAVGRTAETPRQGSRNRTCVVRAMANDGSGRAADANVQGMRYLKASETLNYVGVAVEPVHRVRSVAAVSPVPMSGNRTALDYLLERRGTTLAALEDELCSHIDREHGEWAQCWERHLQVLIDLAAYSDTPLARCIIELSEIRWQWLDWEPNHTVQIANEAVDWWSPFSDWYKHLRYFAPYPDSELSEKFEECEDMAFDIFDAHGIENPWAD